MRRLALLSLLLAVSACGKKEKPPPVPVIVAVEEEPADPKAEREQLLAALRKQRSKAQQEAPEALGKLAQSDPEVVPALVAALADKGTAGPGRATAAAVGSTREAAVRALLAAGPAGEKALVEQALPKLREGLRDENAPVREHTAFAIGLLGPLGRPAAPDLLRMWTDPDARVRAAAYDAVRDVGVPDLTALTKLLAHDDPDIRRLAGELVSRADEVPAAAVGDLAAALNDQSDTVRTFAAQALATAGPAAAPALPALVARIGKEPPDTLEPSNPLQAAVWSAVVGVGEPAAGPLAGLLTHADPLVRLYAARALGDIGPPAKASAAALRKLLADPVAQVAMEAACSLCRVGDKPDDAVAVVKAGLANTTPGVPTYAVMVVGRMGPAGAPLVPDALAKLSAPDPYTRFAALDLAASLPAAQAAKAVPEVAKLLADDEETLRSAAATVLERLGPRAAAAAKPLGEALTAEGQSPGVVAQVVAALVALGPAAKPASASMLKFLADPGTPRDLSVKVLRALAAADPGSSQVAAGLVKAAADPDKDVRAEAAAALGKLDPLPPSAVTLLTTMLSRDRERLPRVAAAKALAEAGPRAKAARPQLEKVAAGPNLDLAVWAKVAIAGTDGDPSKAGPAVREALGHKFPAVRAAAAEALPLVGPPNPADLPALTTLFKDAMAKAPAALAVARLGPAAKPAVPKLADLLSDKDGDVRAAAADALGSLGDAARPAIPKLLAGVDDGLSGPAARRALDRLGVKPERAKKEARP